MNAIYLSITHFFENLPDKLRNHRIKIWFLFLVTVVGLGAGLPGLTFDMSMESWFRKSDPVMQALNRFRDSFGGDDSVYIVYRAKDGDVFSDQSLKAVQRFQNDIQDASFGGDREQPNPLSHIIEVETLINVSYMDVQGDTLTSRDFVGDAFPTTEAEREKLRRQALEHKDYPLFYLSRDSQYGGIYIRTDFGSVPVDDSSASDSDVGFGEEPDLEAGFDIEPESTASSGGRVSEREVPEFKITDMAEYAEFTRRLKELINTPEVTEHLELYPVGNPVVMALFDEILNVEMSYIFTATLLLIMVILLILFRSGSAVLWPISLVILSCILVLGFLGWLGTTMSMMFSLLTMLILVVGVADAVHILSGYLYFRRHGQAHREALRSVYRKSGFACLLTSITTSLGLLAMIFVPIPPIAIFGASAALGVMSAFALTVFILPLMMDLWHPISDKQAKRLEVQKQRKSWVQRCLQWLAPISSRFPKRIAAVFLVVAAVAVYGLLQVRVDSNMVELIREGHPYRTAVELVDRVMGGTQSMEVHLGFGKMDALKDPRVLNAMEALQEYLETEQPKFVVKTESLVNVVKNSYQVLNEDREEMYIIPQDPRTLEQTLFLFNSANPDDRQQLVTDDYREGRISVRLHNYGSIAYLTFLDASRRKISALFDPLRSDYPEMEVQITGGLALMMQMIDYISWSQIQSFGLALAVISVLLLFVFGSVKLGLAALIPNLFPVLMTFGTMGLLGVPLDGDTLIIAPIVIGIAVDDTIHFMTHFRTDLHDMGDVTAAITHTIREVGQAITFSTIILVLGFLTLVVSTHLGMARFGYLTAVAFVSALLADLLLLPAICYLVFGRTKAPRLVT